jgi:hypothetical protein
LANKKGRDWFHDPGCVIAGLDDFTRDPFRPAWFARIRPGRQGNDAKPTRYAFHPPIPDGH